MSVSKIILNVKTLLVIISIMNWIFFALLAPAILALVNFIDKYLVSKAIKDYRAMVIYTSIVGFIFGTIWWILFSRNLLPIRDSLIILTTGILSAWSLIVYFKALSFEETSKIIFLFQIFPIFTIILSFIFLKETLIFSQVMGIILILISSLLVVLNKEKNKFKISNAFFYILLFDLLYAITGVMIKYALNINSFSNLLAYESWGVGLGGLIIFLISKPIRLAFIKNQKKIKKQAFGSIIFNEVLMILGKSFSFFAFSLGSVSLVSVLENTQVFYGIVYGAILTLLWPKIFNESTSFKDLSKKVVLGIILVIGIILIKK